MRTIQHLIFRTFFHILANSSLTCYL
uniref:Uncharacterized protein n=1 Tax=Rhizophora mucronata TaxID=61149 RepID=A0A2P2QTS6_RHIMU